MAKDDFLSAGKVAEQLGVKPNDVKKAIKELGLEPDLVKGGCSMYGAESIEKIKGKLS